MVRSLLQLPERWPCHIWLVGRMKFALIEINSGGGRSGPFSLYHSGSSPDMTEILLTEPLSLDQSIIFLSIILNMSFRCSKEPTQQDCSFDTADNLSNAKPAVQQRHPGD